MLVLVYTYENATLLEVTYHSPYMHVNSAFIELLLLSCFRVLKAQKKTKIKLCN